MWYRVFDKMGMLSQTGAAIAGGMVTGGECLPLL